MVGHAYNPNLWKRQRYGGSGVQGQSGLYSKFKARLNYMRAYLYKKKTPQISHIKHKIINQKLQVRILAFLLLWQKRLYNQLKRGKIYYGSLSQRCLSMSLVPGFGQDIMAGTFNREADRKSRDRKDQGQLSRTCHQSSLLHPHPLKFPGKSPIVLPAGDWHLGGNLYHQT